MTSILYVLKKELCCGYTTSKWFVWPVNSKHLDEKLQRDVLTNCAIFRKSGCTKASDSCFTVRIDIRSWIPCVLSRLLGRLPKQLLLSEMPNVTHISCLMTRPLEKSPVTKQLLWHFGQSQKKSQPL